MKFNRLFLLASLFLIILAGCKTTEPDPWVADDPVPGCTDPNSLSYNPAANQDDGSCEYPDNYFPTSNGNYWDLAGALEIPFLGTANFNGDFDMVKDTVINGMKYVISEEVVGSPDFSQFSQSNRYAYRKDNQGVVYRIDLADVDLIEGTFLDYPLELNDEWYDTPNEDRFLCKVNSISNQSVSAGTFSNVVEVLYTDLNTGNAFSVFFAKDVGIVKVAISFEAPVIGALDIIPELVAYDVNPATIK